MTQPHGPLRVPYYFWIAWRYLIARVRQTALTIVGVALGVAIVAIMQSYMGGFLNFFTERALQSTPSVTVTQRAPGLPNPAGPVLRALRGVQNLAVDVTQLPIPEDTEALENPRQAEEIIARIPGVTTVAPFINGQGIILNGDLREPVAFIGIRPLQEARVTAFADQLISGTPTALAQTANGIMLGTVLADNLGTDIGDRVTVISQDGVSRRFQVVGIYSSELRDVDLVRAFVNLRQAQQLLDMRGISGLGVRTATRDDAEQVARQIEARTDYTAESWREANANILDLFTTISVIIYLVVGFTMIVAGFGIANTLVLTVNEKRRDVGVLKAMGVPPRRITLIFIGIGGMVGIIGVLLGILLGAGGIVLLANTTIPLELESHAGGLAMQKFPMLQIPRVYIVAALFGLLVSLLSSVLPSVRAAKADPLAVIRGAE